MPIMLPSMFIPPGTPDLIPGKLSRHPPEPSIHFRYSNAGSIPDMPTYCSVAYEYIIGAV